MLSVFDGETDHMLMPDLSPVNIRTAKKKLVNLEQLLSNNKQFLNMVIHDMKNPTN